MTSPRDRLTVAEVAELVGVKPSTWRGYVARGSAPQPSRFGSTPYWTRAAVEKWQAERRGPGWHGPHPNWVTLGKRGA